MSAPGALRRMGMARSILIIEDDPDIAEVFRYILEKEEFETRVACNGAEGLSASLDKDNPPALILLDLLMPGMSGLEVCRRLRREPSTECTPIVMVTAKASEADCASAWAAGVDDYITKPFSIRTMIERITALLDQRENGP
jgi:DNA-binding response OmpR family regulator